MKEFADGGRKDMVRILILSMFLLLSISFLPYNARTDDTVNFEMETVVSGLQHPWSLAFLPDGRMLVSERPGRLRMIDKDGAISPPVKGLPPMFAQGQGGLLDLLIDPGFAKNRLIYFSYSEPVDDMARTAVASGRLVNGRLEELHVIFRQQPATEGENHFGSRLAWAADGTLFITLGERFDHMDEAQSIANTLGTIVRIHPDGSIPEDNPFVGQEGARAEIWSYGHRNVQGAAIHPKSGKLWIHEHGPRGGDEINIPVAGKNYGWPEASYGIHYWLVPIRDEHAEQGFEEPIYHWTPSIAPSGMLFYTGDRFLRWKDHLFIGALAARKVVVLELDGARVVSEYSILEKLGSRIRDVAQDSEGYIYLLTDEDDGKLLKLVPKR